jgi:hypothetical protein
LIQYCKGKARQTNKTLHHHAARRGIIRMKDEGIIEEVTEWCAPIVPVPKKNGQVRICVDLKKLNEAVKRERYVLPSLI